MPLTSCFAHSSFSAPRSSFGLHFLIENITFFPFSWNAIKIVKFITHFGAHFAVPFHHFIGTPFQSVIFWLTFKRGVHSLWLCPEWIKRACYARVLGRRAPRRDPKSVSNLPNNTLTACVARLIKYGILLVLAPRAPGVTALIIRWSLNV